MKGATGRKRTHALSSPFTRATSRVVVAEEGRSTSFRHHRRRRCREEERERDRAKGERFAPPAASAGGIAAVRVSCRCQLRAELPWLSPLKPSPSLPLELVTGREEVTVVGVAVTVLSLLIEGC